VLLNSCRKIIVKPRERDKGLGRGACHAGAGVRTL
jgi:hypothetical protein